MCVIAGVTDYIMERNRDFAIEDTSHRNGEVDVEGQGLSLNFFLDHVGEVVLTLKSDGLSWELIESTSIVSIFQIVT